MPLGIFFLIRNVRCRILYVKRCWVIGCIDRTTTEKRSNQFLPVILKEIYVNSFKNLTCTVIMFDRLRGYTNIHAWDISKKNANQSIEFVDSTNFNIHK